MKWSQRSVFSFTADEEKYKSFTFESICLNTCLYTHTRFCAHTEQALLSADLTLKPHREAVLTDLCKLYLLGILINGNCF